MQTQAGAQSGSTPAVPHWLCDPHVFVPLDNVHDACTKDRFTAGLNAPKETVDLYNTTILDTWKVQGAMTTELDYGVGNVLSALKETGMWVGIAWGRCAVIVRNLNAVNDPLTFNHPPSRSHDMLRTIRSWSSSAITEAHSITALTSLFEAAR